MQSSNETSGGQCLPLSDTIVKLEQILRDIRDALVGIDPRGWIGLEKASRYLDVPVSTLRQWARFRDIPYSKEGKRLLFRVRDLDKWLESRAVRRRV